MQTSSVPASRIRQAALLLWRHRVALLALFCGVLAPLILLEDLVDVVRSSHPLPLDEQILHAIHTHASPHKDWAVVWLTR